MRAPVAHRYRSDRRLLAALACCAWLAQTLAQALAQAPGPQAPASPAGAVPPTSAADALPPPATGSREQAYAEFKRRFEARDYAAAVAQARVVVALAERSQPADAEALQVALMNLGLAERMAGDYLASEATYQRVIALIEGAGRLASPRLARANAGLALTYHAARRYDLAVPAFERAIALLRRAEGLFNEEQLPLLDRQADALTELGRPTEALQAHRYALRLVGRRWGEDSLRYARELESLGRWYTRAGAYESARVTFRQTVDLVVELKGPDSLELLGPLTGAAENARRWLTDPNARFEVAPDEDRRILYHDPVIPGPPSLAPSMIASEGLRALERATAIADAHPDAPPASIAAVHVQLGDLFQIRQTPDAALPQYQRAWQAATRAPVQDGRPLQQTLFGDPALLQYALPEGWNRYATRPSEEVDRRLVEIQATVTAQGRLRDPKVLADAGDPKLAQRALRAAESARYRPRFVDGQPVEAPGVRFIQPFYVLREGAAPETGPAAPATLGEPPPAQPPAQPTAQPPAQSPAGPPEPPEAPPAQPRPGPMPPPGPAQGGG